MSNLISFALVKEEKASEYVKAKNDLLVRKVPPTKRVFADGYYIITIAERGRFNHWLKAINFDSYFDCGRDDAFADAIYSSAKEQNQRAEEFYSEYQLNKNFHIVACWTD